MLRGLVAGCWTLALAFLTLGSSGKALVNRSTRRDTSAFRIEFVRHQPPAPNFESCHQLKDDMCEGSPICCRWSIRFWMLTIEDPDTLNIIRRAAACWAMSPLSRATQDLNVFGDEARNRVFLPFFFFGRVFWDKKSPRLLFAVLYVMAGFATITIGGASTLLVTSCDHFHVGGFLCWARRVVTNLGSPRIHELGLYPFFNNIPVSWQVEAQVLSGQINALLLIVCCVYVYP